MTQQLKTHNILEWQKLDWQLLKQLCHVPAPSGDEGPMKDFVLNYIQSHQETWKVKPKIIEGSAFQDCIILVFGEPRTAIFAHMDSIGYMVRYGTELTKIGGPTVRHNDVLVGEDSQGKIECEVNGRGKYPYYQYDREIDRGTNLTFKVDFRQSDEFVQSAYIDNRLGCWNALQVAQTLENGIICFSCYEEHGGGTVEFMAKHIYQEYGVKQALISDITWVTDGIKHGRGVTISMKDKGIPRRKYINRILDMARDSGVDFQIEVENAGGSDGLELQSSPYPFDWCFIGAPEDNVHTPDEKVHKHDVLQMVELYKYLMSHL